MNKKLIIDLKFLPQKKVNENFLKKFQLVQVLDCLGLFVCLQNSSF